MPAGVGKFDHHKKPLNATVFHFDGRVRITGSMFSGATWLEHDKEDGSTSGVGEPLDHALLGFHGKNIKATVIIEEIDPCPPE